MATQATDAGQNENEISQPTEDISMTDVPTVDKKRKQPVKCRKGHEISSTTVKLPSWSYVQLELVTIPAINTMTLDDVTVRSYLTSAFTQFLGLTGSSISVDILKVEERQCWIRVPREDSTAAVAAAGGWIGGSDENGHVGWKVKASGNWLGSLTGKSEIEKMWSG